MNQLLLRTKAILRKIKPLITIEEKQINNLLYLKSEYKEGNLLPSLSGFMPFEEGKHWGGENDSHAWFYAEFNVDEPNENTFNQLVISTNLDSEDAATNPQFLVYINGQLVQGGDNNHRAVQLYESGKHCVYVYCYSGQHISDKLTLKLSVATKSTIIEKTYYDIWTLFEHLSVIDENTREFGCLLQNLQYALNILDLREDNPERFISSCQQASSYLDETVYVNRENDENKATVCCVGSTHIDVAWLWTVRQTREKAQRSFANSISLMKEYPNFNFISSQPVLYQFVKEEAPELYEEIKKRIADGHWEAEGSSWLEPDCNLPSGESLVRQIIYGKKFFKEEFNKDNHILWLPDTFGYPACLPQILRKSGIDQFVATKLSWNDTNDFPYDLFKWKGIDDSYVDSYIITAQEKQDKFSRYTTYLGEGNPKFIQGTWDRFRHKELTNEVLIGFGFGDGGGGPVRNDCEKIERMSCGLPLSPQVKYDTVTNFFKRQKDILKEKKLPIWNGEIYLEFHRGTYTSVGKNKRNNRKSEFAMKNAETLCTMNSVLNGKEYPTDKIEEIYKLILLNQFHDILPGSSIDEVYEQSDIDYAKISADLERLTNDTLATVCPQGKHLFNPNSTDFSGDVYDGKEYISVSDVPALTFAKFDDVKATISPDERVKQTDHLLENQFLKVEFDECYRIVSIYDKVNDRELLPEGSLANRLVAYEDIPYDFDAWEIKEYHKQKPYFIDNVDEIEMICEGSRKGYRITRKYCKSTIKQSIYLYDNTPYVDFENDVEWHTHNTLLKAEFPVDINCDRATCNIQYGNIERAVCKNNSFENAQFEVCAHRFVDYSETNYGVALLNDCKYGHSLEYKKMSLTLLKCASEPHKRADIGKHVFKYAIYPHTNACLNSDVISVAEAYNNPSFVCNGNGTCESVLPIVEVDSSNVVVEAMKVAENGKGVVVRLVEEQNCRTNAKISFYKKPQKIFSCDLMENIQEELSLNEKELIIGFKPYEIKTLYIVF